MMKRFLFSALITVFWVLVQSQPGEKFIKISVTPDRHNWTYRLNETAVFRVNITRSGMPVEVSNVRYSIMPELMPADKTGTLTLKNGTASIEAGTMKPPGFLRCEIQADYNGKTYRGIATAAFAPDQIQPTVTLPVDFDAFWNQTKADLAKIPLQPTMTLHPERCSDKVNVYHVSFRNIGQLTHVWYAVCAKGSG